MNVQQFLEHHRLTRNPFVEEDAQTDVVFKETCIESTFHPAWDKVYGDPQDPSTSIVFGPKGSGKTAMRLQLESQFSTYNKTNADKRVYVIPYVDFNSFLGQFEHKVSWWNRGKPERMLQAWRLWDHMDGILSVGVTKLIELIQSGHGESISESISSEQLKKLERGQARDLLLLALLYDQSTATAFDARFSSLKRRLGFRSWSVWLDFAGGCLWTIVMLALFIALVRHEHLKLYAACVAFPLVALVGWSPYLYRLLRNAWRAWQIRRHLRVGRKSLGQILYGLMRIPLAELTSQPLPASQRSDDRYNLLEKFQGILKSVSFKGLVVLVDRVDEPNLINGLPERMRLFVWPMLDNKLLKHPGLGIKMMLPQELYRFVEKENRDFQERARLDKQNVIAHFAWTGEALYDLVAARMKACAMDQAKPKPEDWFDSRITHERLVQVMQSLNVPRHLFRFLYRLLSEHCKKFTHTAPDYKIQPETFESVLAVYQRELLSAENP